MSPETESKNPFRPLSAVCLPLVLLAVALYASYDRWGYQRYLAVESYPIGATAIFPEFQFSLEYRKRFDWLPGSESRLVAVTQPEIESLREHAVAAYDWKAGGIHGSTYCFTSDFKPLTGWTSRQATP